MGINQLSVALEAHVLSRPMPAAPRPINITEVDEPELPTVESIGVAEGQSFMIEYVDSAGRPSSRRITVYGIDLGRGGIPLLTARCHERKATRQFRVDRIRCCIDFSGEVHDDVAGFLEENFGMALHVARRQPSSESKDRWRDVLALIRDDAVLLAAMSQSDGSIHNAEVAAASAYLMKVAESATGTMLSDQEGEAIASHFRRLRPTGDAINRALEGISRQPAEKVRKLLLAAVSVLDADGQRHPAELELLNAICLDLTGVGIGRSH
jgi:predicted DNA-binding transcriptional regulator YafY